MSFTEITNLTGLVFNVMGSFLLAVSLTKYLTSIHGVSAIHDMQIDAIINRREKILYADNANLLRDGLQNSKKNTTIGLIFISIGFILQLIPYLMLLYKCIFN